MGYIMEKEQSHEAAAECYENAWAFCSQSNPAIGYKLAYNYLKSRRHVEAIDVAQTVLRLLLVLTLTVHCTGSYTPAGAQGQSRLSEDPQGDSRARAPVYPSLVMASKYLMLIS